MPLFLVWLLRLHVFALLIALLLAASVRILYWQAQRDGYTRFVPRKTPWLPPEKLNPLKANERVPLRATGIFSLNDREAHVLLRPAHYWQVPLGDHIVMVEQVPGKYLYQFFNGTNLQEIRHGWLIFGPEPIPSLAVTFMVTWGPEYSDQVRFYYVDGGQQERPPTTRRTVYFTFEQPEKLEAVWHTMVQDARRVRSEGHSLE
ncbi:MAG: hypothetical protein D6706_05065 [Chloroflexi bacterium]|nr:MAG: hypothetical protein D6706_05065 [Chloroflexota bacterium]